jgi:type VI secretion system protein ImpG
MDPRLLDYYNRELRFMREMGGEFAQEMPKIAARLGLESFECADPYVERLLEGFAFLAARVQLKIDSEFPTFTQHMLEMVYPHYLAPTPSMCVVELEPDLAEGALAEGYDVPRDTVLRGTLGKGDQTACEYRTAHDLRLWPLELTAAEYFSHAGPVATELTSLLYANGKKHYVGNFIAGFLAGQQTLAPQIGDLLGLRKETACTAVETAVSKPNDRST